MKKLKKIVIYSAVLIVMILLYLFICNKPEYDVKTIKTRTHTEYVKNAFNPIYIPADPEIITKFVYITETDTIFQTDTVYKIVNDYFAKYFYQDTIMNDTNGVITVFDTICQNKLIYRKADICLISTSQILTKKAKGIYVGVGSGIQADHINLSGNVYFLNDKNIFGAGYNTDKQILLNYGRKIGK